MQVNRKKTKTYRVTYPKGSPVLQGVPPQVEGWQSLWPRGSGPAPGPITTHRPPGALRTTDMVSTSPFMVQALFKMTSRLFFNMPKYCWNHFGKFRINRLNNKHVMYSQSSVSLCSPAVHTVCSLTCAGRFMEILHGCWTDYRHRCPAQ